MTDDENSIKETDSLINKWPEHNKLLNQDGANEA